MIRTSFYTLTLILISVLALGQSRIGSWEDHVNLNSASSIAYFNDKIYSSNYSSVFVYDESDNSITKINKINGLSDVGIKFIRNNPNNNRLMVVYENSNIDVIKADNSVENYSDLFRKNFSGKKNVNEMLFDGKLAYISCGFGIALFDTEKLEIKDTYVIGPNGTNLEVFQLAMTDSVFYAATPLGLYKCRRDQLPNNYQNWKKVTQGIPSGYYGNVVFLNNTVIASYSPYKESLINLKDTVYAYTSNNTWTKFSALNLPYNIKKMKVMGDKLYIIDHYGSLFLNSSFQNIAYVTGYNSFFAYPADGVVKGEYFYIADLAYGLIKTKGSSSIYAPEFIKTNGLNRSAVANIDVHNGKVATSAIFIDSGGGGPLGSKEGVNVNEDGDWSYLRNENAPDDTIQGQCHVLFDRKDPNRMWVSSWIKGLVEYKNNKVYKIYNGSNTGGAMEIAGDNNWRTSGKDMDEQGNLWFASSDVSKYLNVKKTNGTFQNYKFDGTARFVRKVHCDKNGQVWILHERDQGITVAKFNKSNYQMVGYKILNKNSGTGNLGSNSVFSIVEDLDGKIWIGTANGIRVFNSPNNILTGGSADGEPIKIVQDGNVELLLDAEVVTCMDVDAANNKWVGTAAGGVYCFSSDGQRQIHHFTADNSPLYSNEIVDLKVNGKTGDVFIASTIGLQSYKSVIIEGKEDYNGIYAFPNPVKPGYAGNLYVTGLVDNSVVKIADEYGNFVWETKSQGGRIEWPLKTFAGNKVTSGVYVIYAATTDAELRAVSESSRGELMQVKDKGLVLQSIKYADKKNIIRLFTREHGVVTCMARISKSNTSKVKPSTLMNMNLVDVEFIHKQNKEIQLLTEASCIHIYSSIHTDIHKLSILQFINEVLTKTVKEQGPQAELFDFVWHSLMQLDLMNEPVANFHHYFLIELLKYFGFEPVNNFDAEEKYFDCREGKFCGVEFPGPIGLNEQSSQLLSKALDTDILHQKLSNAQRADLLESLLSYYRFHIPGFNELKCLEILKEIASA